MASNLDIPAHLFADIHHSVAADIPLLMCTFIPLLLCCPRMCSQLAPFPYDLVMRELRRYPNAEVVWCQEEHQNMGAYLHVQPRLISCLM
jgi:hypothetical protein